MGFLTKALQKRELTVVDEALWRSWKGSGALSGVKVTPETALTFSAVFAAHKILAESTAMLPLFVMRRLKPRGKEPANNHPLYRVLHDVGNPEMDAYIVRETLTSHMVGWGKAFAKIDYDINGQVDALWPIHPARVETRRNEALQLVFDVTLPSGQKKTYQWFEMFYLRGLSPDGVNVYTPIKLQKEGIGLALAAEGYGASFFGNGAVPKAVLMHPKVLGEKARSNITESWNNDHQGVSRANKIALLEEGMTYENIGLPPEDAQFLGTRAFQVEEVGRWYRIPSMMLNLSGANSTYASVEAFGLQFVIYTLYPWLVRWEKAGSMQLLLERERRTLLIEHLMTAILRGDTTSRYAAYGTGRQWGWLSVNDIREYENMNPIDGGDTYLTPANMLNSSSRAQRAALPIYMDAIQRILRREANDIRAAAQKLLKRGAEDFSDWLAEFYQEHQDFIARNLTPAAYGYAEMLAEGQDLAAVQQKVTESVRLFALRRANQAQGEIKNALSGDDPARGLEEILSGWDSGYAERICRIEISRQTAVLAMPVNQEMML